MKNVRYVLALIILFANLSFGATSKLQKIIDERQLTAEGVAKLEASLVTSPTDLHARSTLLRHYMLSGFMDAKARIKRSEHVFWIIENRPDSEIAGSPETQLHPIFDGEKYLRAKALWAKQVEKFPKNPAVLRNAVAFNTLYVSAFICSTLPKPLPFSYLP